ncbi:hypothetical protein [Xylophilus sp.]|uniref:hypothetical protein n=1 Tax=Xylophilus sp. TaxID=2653893 RepID=UPI0013B79786|nr:hypothetical protein [Xylophilus sp.]KAF1049855.1 MAG: hypothetical protein GAK38_00518 [Xylophilus sp.]
MTTASKNPLDRQTSHTGKVKNDTNRAGAQDATQKNEPRRTPESRSDRESHVGSGNQSQSRQGGAGGSR